MCLTTSSASEVRGPLTHSSDPTSTPPADAGRKAPSSDAPISGRPPRSASVEPTALRHRHCSRQDPLVEREVCRRNSAHVGAGARCQRPPRSGARIRRPSPAKFEALHGQSSSTVAPSPSLLAQLLRPGTGASHRALGEPALARDLLGRVAHQHLQHQRSRSRPPARQIARRTSTSPAPPPRRVPGIHC